jgi:pimeloyl-ACP methyl ester carboxylesterase
LDKTRPSGTRRDANEAPLALRAFTDGTGPSLVMLGGGTAGVTGFASHAADLATDFRVIRLQTLNVECAETQYALPSGYSIKAESRAMSAALDVIAPTERLDLIGHSFGALVALDFALDHQERVRSLVLSEPPAFWVVPNDEFRTSPDMQHMTALVRQFSPTHEPTDAQLVEFLRALGDYDTSAPATNDPRSAQWLRTRHCLRGLSAVPDHIDEVERLKSFRRPVLLITGANSPRFHRRINELLAAHLPLVERAELPGGHSAVNTARSESLVRVRSFLADTNGLFSRSR